MKKEKKSLFNLLFGIGFASLILGAVFMGYYVYLTAYVYGDSIIGYAPAGISSISIQFLATVILLIYFFILAGMKRQKPGRLILGGILGSPLGMIIAAYYSLVMFKFIDYSLEADVIVKLIGSIVFAVSAIMLHIHFIKKYWRQHEPSSNPYSLRS